MNCRDCGSDMRVYELPRPRGGADTLAECKNRDCDLHDVTLDVRTWQTITDEELERSYRTMVRQMREVGTWLER